MNENNTTSKSIVLLAMLLGLLAGIVVAPKVKGGSDEEKPHSTVGEVYDLISGEYVDRLEGDSLDAQLVAGMLSTLDPHSNYLSAKELQKQQEELSGGFDGIGVVLRYRNDTVWAGEVMAGSPAERAGVHPGDRIITVDDSTVSGAKRNVEYAVKLIRGRKGTKVTLGLLRGVEAKPLKVAIARGSIFVPSVPYSGMLDKTTGYIKVIRFGETTYREFHHALANLKAQGMERLVIDLRGNGGGLLEAAVDIANDLLPNGRMIVYTEGAHMRRSNTYARGKAFYEGEVTVMIDELSASASEVVSGAIQDNDRGMIVGRRSFGKGLVQRQFDLSDGSALWLTVARYYTPSGRCIQRPYDKGSDEYYASYLERMLAEMESDSIVSEVTDTTKYYTNKGRVVYGGGGIFPDKVLSYLRDEDLVYVNGLLNRGCLTDLALECVMRDYEALRKRYPTADDFVANFVVDNAMMERLYALGEKKGVKKDAKSARKYDSLLRTTLKANLGECLYGAATYYRINVASDHELQQAVASF
ncbi:MAG: S41 family peptidase [Bacteroidales bacterium]|nr:S41 family peptidase [Bacteroidales bacterium]